ncbi:MAG: nitroreductase family protein [Candidatus Bathyarchaeia archaeon]
MDFFDVVKSRRSVRSYAPTPISNEDLIRILEAGILAPSAGSKQPWHFIVVVDREKRVRIAKGCRYGRFLAESPAVIVGCGDREASPKWYAIDTAIAMEHMVLAATALGLGTCWIGSFNGEDIRMLLEIPRRFEIVALLAVGYPRGKLDILGSLLHIARPRKKLEAVASVERYGKTAALKTIHPFHSEELNVYTISNLHI